MSVQSITSLMLEHTLTSTLLSKKLDVSLSAHGVSYTEFVIMHRLYASQGGSLSRIALAEAVGLTASGVTRILAPMEKNNVVRKVANPRDARQSLVGLTDTGKELYADATASFEHACNAAFSLFEDEEIEQLAKLLNKIKC